METAAENVVRTKESNGFCLSCGKRLKKNVMKNGFFFNYHISCWDTMLYDIKNFSTVAYTKYNYKKRICGLTEDEIRAGATIVVHFD